MPLEILTPHTRGLIVRQLKETSEWTGRRNGIAMKFRVSDQPNFANDRIEWRARIRGATFKGMAGTVADAEAQIAAADRRQGHQ